MLKVEKYGELLDMKPARTPQRRRDLGAKGLTFSYTSIKTRQDQIPRVINHPTQTPPYNIIKCDGGVATPALGSGEFG